MKNKFTICGIQIASKPNDVAANVNKGAVWIKKAKKEFGAKLVVFPETVTTGFNTGLSKKELYELVDFIPGHTTELIQKTAAQEKVFVIWTTYERGKSQKIYNSAVIINDKGEIIGKYRKLHPFSAEKKWVTRGEKYCLCQTPLGKIGIIICYDGDFPELARLLAVKGAKIIVRPSAFLRPFDVWLLTNQARAYDSHTYLVAVNTTGQDAGGAFYYGHSMIVSPLGQRLAQATAQEEIIYADVIDEPRKYISYGSHLPLIVDNIADRNLDAYQGLLKKAKSPWK